MYDKWVAPQCCPPNGDGDVEITKADGEGFADVGGADALAEGGSDACGGAREAANGSPSLFGAATAFVDAVAVSASRNETTNLSEARVVPEPEVAAGAAVDVRQESEMTAVDAGRTDAGGRCQVSSKWSGRLRRMPSNSNVAVDMSVDDESDSSSEGGSDDDDSVDGSCGGHFSDGGNDSASAVADGAASPSVRQEQSLKRRRLERGAANSSDGRTKRQRQTDGRAMQALNKAEKREAGRTGMLQRVSCAAQGLQRGMRTAYTFDSEGSELPFVKGTLKRQMQDVKDHIRSHAEITFDITKLAYVMAAVKVAKRVLMQENVYRAISLDDTLMYEGWRCFDPAYALDSLWMAYTGFGELMGPRVSDCFAALRAHVKPSPTTSGARWARFSGKNNQTVLSALSGV